MLLLVAMLACGTDPAPPSGSPVERPTADPRPCDPGWSANTQVSVPGGVAVVERFDGRRRVGQLVVPLDEVVGLEHERVAHRCSAIYLHLADGRRLLFDAAHVDLGPRTLRLAELVGLDTDAVAGVPLP